MAKDEGKQLRLADEVIDGELVKSKGDAAYDMLLAGKSHSEIADELGFNRVEDVTKTIEARMNHWATSMRAKDRIHILAVELARLDKLHAAFWDAAQDGDVSSGKFVLEVAKERNKLNKMYEPEAQVNQAAVLVVGGQEQDYVDNLKRMLGHGD